MALLSGLGAGDPCDLYDDAWVVLEFTPEKFAGVKAGPRGQIPIPFPSPLLFCCNGDQGESLVPPYTR